MASWGRSHLGPKAPQRRRRRCPQSPTARRPTPSRAAGPKKPRSRSVFHVALCWGAASRPAVRQRARCWTAEPMSLITGALAVRCCPISDQCETCNALRRQLAEAQAERMQVLAPAGRSEEPPPGQEPCGNCSPLARLTRENHFLSQRNTEVVARLRRAGIPARQTRITQLCE